MSRQPTFTDWHHLPLQQQFVADRLVQLRMRRHMLRLVAEGWPVEELACELTRVWLSMVQPNYRNTPRGKS